MTDRQREWEARRRARRVKRRYCPSCLTFGIRPGEDTCYNCGEKPSPKYPDFVELDCDDC
jgi:hypothetical protein